MKLEVKTALGSARGRFLQGLPRRAAELEELAALLEREPTEAGLCAEARRRLQSLHASAQVFQEQAMADAIAGVIAQVDAACDSDKPLMPRDIEAMRGLAQALSRELDQARRELVSQGGDEDPSGMVESRAEPASSHAGPGSGARKRTLIGAAGLAPTERRDDRISELFRPHPLLAGRTTPSGRPDPALSLTQSVSGLLPAPRVLAVLALGGVELQREVRAALPAERCELTISDDADTALEVMPNVAPDVVVVEGALALGSAVDLIARMRAACFPRASGGELTVLAVASDDAEAAQLAQQAGADGVMERPLLREQLHEAVERLATGYGAPRTALEALTSGTVDDIARSVAEEIHRGIAQSLLSGHDARIELSDKAELMAAAWSAIGRIRSHLVARANGKLSFREAAYAGGPAVLALGDGSPAAPVNVGESLKDRRVLVADDDPAVLWFFAGLLREAGAVVLEAKNGKEALELARRKSPDVVVSDILMPRIDGFALCRELQSDVMLAHVPVILLSWKEDFLERMRELSAGAAGYLRKEAGSQQILSTVAGALRPRIELENLLAAGDEVRGRVERVGVLPLLWAVSRKRPDARVSIRDANNLFEVDLREGSRLAVTRTAADGSFARGHTALRQLLGVSVGRFTVLHESGPLRGAFAEPLDKVLLDSAKHLGAMLDAVSGRRLMRLCRLELDDEVLGSLLSATPTVLAEVVGHLKTGDPPVRDLVVHGAFPAQDLEEQLHELVRRGAVVRVVGEDGVDLTAEALQEREDKPGTLMRTSEPPRASSPPDPVRWQSPPESVRPYQAEPGLPLRDGAEQREWFDAEPDTRPQRPRRKTARGPVPSAERERSVTPVEPVAVAPADAAAAQDDPAAPDPKELEQELDELLDEAAAAAPQRSRQATAPGVAPASGQAPAAEKLAAEKEARGELVGHDDAPEPWLSVPARSRVVDQPMHQVPPQAMGRRPRGGTFRLVATLAAFAFVGFVLWRAIRPAPGPPPAAPQTVPPPVQPAAGAAQTPPAEPALPAPAEHAKAEQASEGRPQAELQGEVGFGRVLPFIDRSRAVEVKPGEGLLVVEYEAGGTPPQVQVAGHDLGPAPTQVALAPGRHELVLKRGERSSFRYLVIRAGETRIVDVE